MVIRNISTKFIALCQSLFGGFRTSSEPPVPRVKNYFSRSAPGQKFKIPGPGKFRNHTFSIIQNWVLGPKNDCHNTETALCQLLSVFVRRFYPITLEIGPRKLQRLKNQKILLRKPWEMIFYFFGESSVMTGFEGIYFGTNFQIQKKCNPGSHR